MVIDCQAPLPRFRKGQPPIIRQSQNIQAKNKEAPRRQTMVPLLAMTTLVMSTVLQNCGTVSRSPNASRTVKLNVVANRHISEYEMYHRVREMKEAAALILKSKVEDVQMEVNTSISDEEDAITMSMAFAAVVGGGM